MPSKYSVVNVKAISKKLVTVVVTNVQSFFTDHPLKSDIITRFSFLSKAFLANSIFGTFRNHIITSPCYRLLKPISGFFISLSQFFRP